jgi:hypothetical protein
LGLFICYNSSFQSACEIEHRIVDRTGIDSRSIDKAAVFAVANRKAISSFEGSVVGKGS